MSSTPADTLNQAASNGAASDSQPAPSETGTTSPTEQVKMERKPSALGGSKGPKTVDADFAALTLEIDDPVSQDPPAPLDIGSPSDTPKSTTDRTPKGSEKPYIPTCTNVFIAGIPAGWDEKKLIELCEPFGEIASVKLVLNRHYAFVMFKDQRAADRAIKGLHCVRTGPQGGLLHVALAMHDEAAEEEAGDRLFIRGLPPWVNREEVKNLFQPFGNLTECTILYTADGQCKGVAFVAYGAIEEATKAKDTMNNRKLDQWNFPLIVRYAETNEVRQVRQQRNRERIMRSTPTTTPTNRLHTPHHLPGSAATTPSHMGQGVMGPPPPFPGNVEVLLSGPRNIPANVNLPSPAHAMQTGPRTLPIMTPQHQNTQPIMLTPSHQHQQPHFIIAAPQAMQLQQQPLAFPATGDLLMHGAPLSAEVVAQLVARFGPVEQMASVPNNGGFLVRMKDRNIHPQIAQTLTGVLFSTGHVLQVALIQT